MAGQTKNSQCDRANRAKDVINASLRIDRYVTGLDSDVCVRTDKGFQDLCSELDNAVIELRADGEY